MAPEHTVAPSAACGFHTCGTGCAAAVPVNGDQVELDGCGFVHLDTGVGHASAVHGLHGVVAAGESAHAGAIVAGVPSEGIVAVAGDRSCNAAIFSARTGNIRSFERDLRLVANGDFSGRGRSTSNIGHLQGHHVGARGVPNNVIGVDLGGGIRDAAFKGPAVDADAFAGGGIGEVYFVAGAEGTALGFNSRYRRIHIRPAGFVFFHADVVDCGFAPIARTGGQQVAAAVMQGVGAAGKTLSVAKIIEHDELVAARWVAHVFYEFGALAVVDVRATRIEQFACVVADFP